MYCITPPTHKTRNHTLKGTWFVPLIAITRPPPEVTRGENDKHQTNTGDLWCAAVWRCSDTPHTTHHTPHKRTAGHSKALTTPPVPCRASHNFHRHVQNSSVYRQEIRKCQHAHSSPLKCPPASCHLPPAPHALTVTPTHCSPSSLHATLSLLLLLLQLRSGSCWWAA